MKRLPVRWSDEAIQNLRDIRKYIGCDSPQRAAAFCARIVRSAFRLGMFPKSGRKVPELLDQMPQPREILVGEYRLIYRLISHKVEIVIVSHGRRLLPF